MEGNRKGQQLVIAALLVAVIAMSIGFATFTRNITIGGTVVAKSAKWKVQYDTSTYAEQTGSVAATSHDLGITAWTFNVTLKPGEKYEATADVVNLGDFDAKLSKVTMTSLTEAQQKYLRYTVYVNGSSYTQTTDNLNVSLSKKVDESTHGTHPVKVLVEYVIPADEADLLSSDTTVSLSATLEYVQAQ